MVIRKEEQLGDFTIPQLAIRPAILAAGKLLAIGLATEPVAAYPITNVEGIPKILNNRATIIENIPVNVVCEIDSSLLTPLYHLSGCKSAYAMTNHPSIIYTAIADTIARVVRQYLLLKVRRPANIAEVKRNAEDLNRRLQRLITQTGLLVEAKIDEEKCDLRKKGTRVTQYLPLTITFKGVTTDFEIDFQSQLA